VKFGYEQLAVESEEVGVATQEGDGVRLGRQLLEAFLFEGREVLRADADLALSILQPASLACARLAEVTADLEHSAASRRALDIVPAVARSPQGMPAHDRVPAEWLTANAR
jgi:hypothetical protein